MGEGNYKMNKKAFTFEQLAVILIVVLGLVIVVVLVTTQARKAGGSFGNIGEDVSTKAGSLSGTSACELGGNTCATTCAAAKRVGNIGDLGCASTEYCCSS